MQNINLISAPVSFKKHFKYFKVNLLSSFTPWLHDQYDVQTSDSPPRQLHHWLLPWCWCGHRVWITTWQANFIFNKYFYGRFSPRALCCLTANANSRCATACSGQSCTAPCVVRCGVLQSVCLSTTCQAVASTTCVAATTAAATTAAATTAAATTAAATTTASCVGVGTQCWDGTLTQSACCSGTCTPVVFPNFYCLA